jgi:hypothetical protein
MGFQHRDSILALESFRTFDTLTADDPTSCDLLSYARGRGHREFPCLSRVHNPSNCVPCVDFSPWLRERVRRFDPDGLGEYLWRVRRASPGEGGTEQVRRTYEDLARSILAAPLQHFLKWGSPDAYEDLRVLLVMLAAHEGFSGFIMAGEAADFAAAAMVPHGFRLTHASDLVQRRNDFVVEMAQDMDYWACWAAISPDAIPSPLPPSDSSFQSMLLELARLPLGARAHAVDVLRHLSAHPGIPRSLESLSRFEVRKWGLDVAESSCLLLESGLVVPAEDGAAWLNGWTRRDLLGFLSKAGVRPRKSWNKERLAELAMADCAEAVRMHMAEAGAVELAPAHAEAAGRLGSYLDCVKETWRVWLAFGTGVES